MKKKKLVSIVMGSQSDWKTLINCEKIFKDLEVGYEKKIISAHRTPDRLYEYSKSLSKKDIEIIIAGAGGAAHLPGMVASISHLPVIGVPIKSRNSIDGWDSILSILQMPAGVPVATVALNGSKNAGILAAQILAISNSQLSKKLKKFKSDLADKVVKDDSTL